MAKQTFTTGQVLTAAQVNSLQANDFNQTVSVKTANYTLAAADKGTRIEFNTSGSVTCTVNSGLFDAGDTLVIQNRGAGTATITAGTATVNTSASLALAQYSAGTLYFVSDSAALFFGDAAGISASIVDAKGDLIVGTADNTVGRLAVGTNGYTLVADSVETTGLKWVAPAGGGANWSLLNAGGTTLSGSSTTVSGISAADKIMVLVERASSGTASIEFLVRFNSDTAANYYFLGAQLNPAATVVPSNFEEMYSGGPGFNTSIKLGQMSSNAGSAVSGYLLISGANASGVKVFNSIGAAGAAGGNTQTHFYLGGYYNSSSVISSVTLLTSSSTFDAGKVFVYTSA